MQNNMIATNELDFSNIKSNLQSFLTGQIELSDYDFEGSALSLLLDVLAYNTSYNALYLNLAVNESFLDSASKRNSVVSRAFEMGYMPKSATAATATVNVMVSNILSTVSILTLPALSPFKATIAGNIFTFYNLSPITAKSINNTFSFNNIDIIEGTQLLQSYIVSAGAKYEISNANCDLSTLTVTVYDNSMTSAFTVYSPITDILNISGNDTVYFTKEISDGLYEIQFGNGKFGKSLVNGNIVVLKYMATNKGAANGAKLFTLNNIFSGSTTISTSVIANGGSEPELTDEIRFNSPKYFSSANRAVTPSDYKSLLISEFSNINSINVWGGEDNNPPVYGKVFISIVPATSLALSVNEKTQIIPNLLKSKKMIGMTPVFVEPFYLNLNLSCTVYFDSAKTNLTANDIELATKAVILNYNTANLTKFESIFRYSYLSGLIDSIDPSIQSNITTFSIDRAVDVLFNTSTKYTINIGNPIYDNSVMYGNIYTNGFYVLADSNINYIQDDGKGNLQRYYLDTNNNKVFSNIKQGAVDYLNGTIIINNLNVVNLVDAELIFSFIPMSNDVLSVGENIVSIDPLNLVVNAIPISDSSYVFTASR